MRKEKKCEQCGTKFFRHYHARFCFPCADIRAAKVTTHYCKTSPRHKLNQISRNLTKQAVIQGFLLPATEHQCVDCGNPALCYDHRDYNKPLDVDPVCISCNSKRGAGIPFKPKIVDQEKAA